jgi:hypothetical protein
MTGDRITVETLPNQGEPVYLAEYGAITVDLVQAV